MKFGLTIKQRARNVLFEFDGPVGVVEELFPAMIAFASEVDVDEGISFWLKGFFDE